jgi:hypothetical protein
VDQGFEDKLAIFYPEFEKYFPIYRRENEKWTKEVQSVQKEVQSQSSASTRFSRFLFL